VKIEAIRVDVLESEPIPLEWKPARTMCEYPGSRKVRFAHKPFEGPGLSLDPGPVFSWLLRIRTDAGIETCGVLGSSLGREHAEWTARTFKAQWAPELVGMDALNREYLWHKMWMARRYFHMASSAPVALIDDLMWDIAGLHAGLPVHKLLGGFRDRVPAYRTVTSMSHEETLEAAALAREQGFKGFKDHLMLGVAGNIAAARALRDLVGDGMALMHDPVQQYAVEEAIQIGRELEGLGYLWIEEPLQDHDIRGLKRVSDALDLPVMALETVAGNPYLAVPYLVEGAIDIVRQSGMGPTGAAGITSQMKLANLAEMFGVNCHGGSAHVVAAVRNDDWWEVTDFSPARHPQPDRVLQTATASLITDTTKVEGGFMYPPQGAGLGREIDWDGIAARTVEKI